jgi:hypothetical protein
MRSPAIRAQGILLFYLVTLSCSLQAADWISITQKQVTASGTRQIEPAAYKIFRVSSEILKKELFTAPLENPFRFNKGLVIELPAPDGSLRRFRVAESPVMETGLQEQFPEFRTYVLEGFDEAGCSGRIDWNIFGMHAMVSSPDGDYYIDPYSTGTVSEYIVYYTKDFTRSSKMGAGDVIPNNSNHIQTVMSAVTPTCSGKHLSTYRLAVACTGEYAQTATGFTAPTVAQTLAKIVTSVNRVNGVYEKELAIRLVLVATETNVIFTNPTSDPFTGNYNASTLLNESQNVINANIGSSNYDIGHTFGTGGDALAMIGVVCMNSLKAKGVTTNPSPFGDPFDIDYVCHEMGHQFSAQHTFNAITDYCGFSNRNGETSVEPGSGITVMGYAGICGVNNLANNSIAYFHSISFDQIRQFISTGNGALCGAVSLSGNQPPVVTAPSSHMVPKQTAFTLTGSATDPDGDLLVYSWEQCDTGFSAGNWNSGSRPYFRSYAPVNVSSRIFPELNVLKSGAYTSTRGEYVPQSAQMLTFRMTVRDNKTTGGGVCYASTSVIVDAAGPLRVSNPDNPSVVWMSGQTATVTWNVNNTDQAPLNCDSVSVSISMDSGNSWTPLTATVNNGVCVLTSPTVATSLNTCRVKVGALRGIYFDISNDDFIISNGSPVPEGVNEQLKERFMMLQDRDAEKILINTADAVSEPIAISIVDLSGRVLILEKWMDGSHSASVSTSTLSPGCYILSVAGYGSRTAWKLLK